MSRTATLTLAFETDLSTARASYDAFVREVEGKPLKVQFEGQAGGAPVSAGARTFSGISGVPEGGQFVAPASTSFTLPSSGAPNLGPVQQAQQALMLQQIDTYRSQLGSATPEGQKILQNQIRSIESKYVREFETLPPYMQGGGAPVGIPSLQRQVRAIESSYGRIGYSGDGPMSAQWANTDTDIGQSSFERQAQAPRQDLGGARISGRTRQAMYSSGGGREDMALSSRGEAQVAAHSDRFTSPSDRRLEQAADQVVAAYQDQARAAEQAANANRRVAARVDSAFDRAALAAQRGGDANERRFAASKDAADFDAFRRGEKADATAAQEAADAGSMAGDEWVAGKNAYFAGKASGGGNFGGITGRDFLRPSGNGQGGGSAMDPAFGFIRPLAAAFFTMHAIAGLEGRIEHEYAAGRAFAMSGTYDDLSSQVGMASSSVQQEEGRFSLHIGGALNWLRHSNRISEAAGNFLFGKNDFTDSSSLAMIRDAAHTQENAVKDDQAVAESRRIRAESRAMGATGYAAEYLQGVEADREIQERIAATTKGQGGAFAGFAALSMAVKARGLMRVGVITANLLNDQGFSSGMAVAGLQESQGLHFTAAQTQMDTRHHKELVDMTKATSALPGWLSQVAIQGLRYTQGVEQTAMDTANERKINMMISRQDWQTEVSIDTRRGFSHDALIAAAKSQFYDKQGNLLDAQGEPINQADKGVAGLVGSRKRAANEAVQVAENTYTRNVAGVTASIAANIALQNRNPLGAQLAQIAGQFAQATVGMIAGSDDYKLLEAQEMAQMGAARIARSDQLEVLSAGIASERRGLKAGLRRDYAGQALEGLTGEFEQRQLGLRDEDQRQQRIDVVKNEALAIDLFRQQYTDAFRGQQLDTRLFSLQNPRDEEDPGKVLGEINDKAGDISQLLAQLISEDD